MTGPQRSGTTICARIISYDTGYRYVDENRYGTKNVVGFVDAVGTEEQVVIQAPAMSRYLDRIAVFDDVAVVWMIRNMAAILSSQKRVKWDGRYERSKYRNVPQYKRDTELCIIKHIYWTLEQREMMPHPFEIVYERLDRHPLWVPARKRLKFKRRQWKIPQS